MRKPPRTAERIRNGSAEPVSGRRVALGYVALLLIFAAAVAIVAAFRPDEDRSSVLPQGEYALASAVPCLGRAGDRVVLTAAGPGLRLDGPGGTGGTLSLEGGNVAGTVRCVDGSSTDASVALAGSSAPHRLEGLFSGQSVEFTRAPAEAEPVRS